MRPAGGRPGPGGGAQLGLYVYGGAPAVNSGDGGGYWTSLPEPFNVETFPLFTGPGGISANDAVTLSGSPSAGWTISYGIPSWTSPTLCGTYSPQAESGAGGTVTVLPASLAQQVAAVQAAIAGTPMDLIDAPNGTAIAAVQAGLATSGGQTSILNAVNAITRNTARSMPVTGAEYLRPATGTTPTRCCCCFTTWPDNSKTPMPTR